MIQQSQKSLSHPPSPLFTLQPRAHLPLNPRRQSLQRNLGIRRRLLNNLDNLPKLGHGGIAHNLINPALGGRDDGARSGQPPQRDGDLLGIRGAHGIGQDVNVVPGLEEVEGGLGDADVGLDADDGDGGVGLEGGGDLGDEHGEAGLVVVGVGAEVGLELGDDGAEAGGVLGCCVDGDGEDFGEFEELLGREDAGDWG